MGAEVAVEPNMAEVTRDEMIRAAMAKIKAKEDEQIRAEAEVIVNAKIEAEEKLERERLDAIEAEKASVSRAKEQAKLLKGFANSVAQWMIENGCTNPSSIPASVVDVLKAQAGL